MHKTRSRALLVAATAISLMALAPGQASAAAPEECSDGVTVALHEVHELTGDPAGLGHEAEETYCGVKP